MSLWSSFNLTLDRAREYTQLVIHKLFILDDELRKNGEGYQIMSPQDLFCDPVFGWIQVMINKLEGGDTGNVQAWPACNIKLNVLNVVASQSCQYLNQCINTLCLYERMIVF